MADRLSPETFLSLMRHPVTGRIDDAYYEHQLERRGRSDDAPRDCVRQFPALDDANTMLVGYDLNGRVRIKIEVASFDGGWFESIIMRYVRWRYGRPLQLVK